MSYSAWRPNSLKTLLTARPKPQTLILSGKVINNHGVQLQQNVFLPVNFKTKQHLGYFRRHSLVLTSYLRKDMCGQRKC